MLTVAQLAPLKNRDPYLYETMVKIVSAVNATGQRAGVDPSTPSPAPSQIASLTVRAANSWFDISITDPSNSRPGPFYFTESDVTPGFNALRVYFMGSSRNFVRPAWQSIALLARLFAIHRIHCLRRRLTLALPRCRSLEEVFNGAAPGGNGFGLPSSNPQAADIHRIIEIHKDSA